MNFSGGERAQIGAWYWDGTGNWRRFLEPKPGLEDRLAAAESQLAEARSEIARLKAEMGES